MCLDFTTETNSSNLFSAQLQATHHWTAREPWSTHDLESCTTMQLFDSTPLARPERTQQRITAHALARSGWTKRVRKPKEISKRMGQRCLVARWIRLPIRRKPTILHHPIRQASRRWAWSRSIRQWYPARDWPLWIDYSKYQRAEREFGKYSRGLFAYFE